LDRILDPNYVPTVEDILHARTKTTGSYETQFVHDGTTYSFIDVGGVRSQRRKWIHEFANVDAIVFTCDVSCYDSPLWEDESQNRMVEQLVLFDSLVNSRWFSNSHMVVMLTKVDKLTARKLAASPFRATFPDYVGHPESVEDMLNYLCCRVRCLVRNDTISVVVCRPDSIASSTTNMAEVAVNAIQRRGSIPT
jgi:guanine nucleotide-binding protein G(i) subunit alpha